MSCVPGRRFRMQGAEYLAFAWIIMDGVATPADDRSYEFASKAMTELFEIFPLSESLTDPIDVSI